MSRPIHIAAKVAIAVVVTLVPAPAVLSCADSKS